MRIGFGLWLATGLSVLATANGAQAQVAVNFTTQNSNHFIDSTSRMLGWQFTVTESLSISDFGWFDWNADGLAVAHDVGLWDVAGSALLATATIPSGVAATLTGGFRYVSLGSNVTLQTGHTYRFAGFDPGSSDPHVWDATLGGFSNIEVLGFSHDSRINLTMGGAIGPGMGSFGFPGGAVGDSRSALLGPNFVIVAVPEPALLSLGAGVAVMAFARWRRQHRV